ncbi:hypothetical protein KY284_027061 [Solanum tuberosum]|nr:hypothetical protein KY284_027061 [Solanum tuberosum]
MLIKTVVMYPMLISCQIPMTITLLIGETGCNLYMLPLWHQQLPIPNTVNQYELDEKELPIQIPEIRIVVCCHKLALIM